MVVAEVHGLAVAEVLVVIENLLLSRWCLVIHTRSRSVAVALVERQQVALELAAQMMVVMDQTPFFLLQHQQVAVEVVLETHDMV